MLKQFSKLLTLVLLVALPLVVQARPVQDIVDEPVPARFDEKARTLVEVRDAIIQGARSKGWQVVPGEGNEVVASILVRNKHYAEVSITYSVEKYSIRYRDSRDLNYRASEHRIHRNYNNWVLNLSNSIKASL